MSAPIPAPDTPADPPPPPASSSSSSSSSSSADPPLTPETVQKCHALLSRRDDTSRFVGLALLSSLLTHITDRAQLLHLWRALPPKFLDRLLRTAQPKATDKDPTEAQSMVDLAVGVLSAFAAVLPPSDYDGALTGRTPALVGALLQAPSPVTRGAVLRVLLALAGVRAGAEALLGVGAGPLAGLLKADGEGEVAAQVVLFAVVNAGAGAAGGALGGFLPVLGAEVRVMGGEVRVKVLRFLAELLTRVPAEQLPDSTQWVSALYDTLTGLLAARHTSATRHAAIIIVAALLHRYPPALLFNPAHPTPPPDNDAKPPLQHFLQLTLITLRASFPSLLESLHSPSYAATSQTLAAAFDITAALLAHLVSLSDDDGGDLSTTCTSLPADALLKLRTDLTETFSLTLEFLRDRWDAAFAGAEGLEPGHEPPGVPLQLTWESALPGGLLRDPIVMASVRALALWLREEETHRAEAGGLMDLWLGLWARGAGAGVDYRVWVVAALEGVLGEEHGRAQFDRYGGWGAVFGDLAGICRGRGGGDDEDELRLGISEARLLAEVVAVRGEAAEEVVKEVVALAGVSSAGGLGLELDAEVLRLASTCLVSVRRGVRGRVQAEVAKVKEVARRIVLDLHESGRAETETEVLALVAEVAEEMEEM